MFFKDDAGNLYTLPIRKLIYTHILLRGITTKFVRQQKARIY